MKKINAIAIVLCMGFLLSSCAAIGGIFKAGVWVGVLLVIGVVLLIIYIATRGSKK